MAFSQLYLFENLFDSPTFFQKRMFGGLALYFEGLMVAVLMEDSEQNYYKELTFDYPIWNGILIPTDRLHQAALVKLLPGTSPHPVLGKWMYLPLSADQYDGTAEKLVELIIAKSPLVGIVPGLKRKPAKKKPVKKVLKKKTAKKVTKTKLSKKSQIKSKRKSH